ncbi:hypothetical protein G7Y89_g7451 [Cudoniella acicularis]|uniref:Uncharacterized protein n=1 Tax=Cudoniella acicularis TaxID=354080 RepID=A0A8H4RII5_9HELO|nr:hypothetical protein G7Y89_g7451 [Cudoniella acicularis]
MSIQHDHTLNPVTGLAFCSSSSGKLLVFAGEGSFLKVFEAERLELVFQCEVFQEQVIHGITINESLCHAHDLKVVIWGGKSILLLTENKLDDFLSYGVASLAGNAKLVSDWILDAAISPQNDGSCVLVTAHNTVIRAKVGQNGEVPLLEELPSPSKSILYSAHVVWDTPSCVLVAAGTVFGEIIVWRSTSSENGAFSVCGTEILFTFTGHEGSIFGVNISPPIEHPGMFGARLLASCSDDRTIRVWDLSKASNTTQQCKDVVLLRETGFGENNELASTQSSVERCVATVMGHASRIWRVKFLVETSSVLGLSFLSILSFGEDATTQQWALNFDSESATPELETVSKSMDTEVFTPLKAKLTQTDIYAFHSGKHIWSTALWISGHKLHNVATGGADGKISIYSANIANKSGYNAFRNQFLATTTFGRILECNLDGTPRWTEISLPESGKMDLKSYAVVKGFPEVGLAFLAGANGKIYARQNDKPVIEVGIVEGKVADMFGIFYQPTGSFQILATTLATNVAISFLIKLTSLDGAQLFTRCSYKLLDKFVVTSAGCCNHLLVLGSRNGSLAIYNPLDKETPMCSWKDPDSGSGDAITTILALCSNSGSNSAKFYFLTTRRNGLYSIFSCMITRNTDGSIKTADILPVHHGSPPFGPMIESAWFQGSDLVLYGFRGKNFVVWNETKQYEVMNVECGGAHRSYAYSPLNIVEGGGHFLYTKASKFYTHSQTKPSHQIAKQGGHGREIKVCAVSPDYEFIATGAEDTSIRIWRYPKTYRRDSTSSMVRTELSI